ncbi:MAG: hypothetical protein AMXMBFR64_05140 [Myxococcales bacterium]
MASIETTWQTVTGLQLAAGAPWSPELLEALGGNNNLLIRRYTASLGAAHFPAPLTPASSVDAYVDFLRFLVPASADARGVTAQIRWRPGAATDGRVRIYSSADSGKSSADLGVAGSGMQFTTLRIDPTDGTDDTIVFAASGLDTVVYSVALSWAQQTGDTVSSLVPLASGACYVNTTATGEADPETEADKPVTDELLNRMARTPRILYADRRGVVMSAHDDMTATRRWKATGAAARTLVMGAFLPTRYPVRVRWYVQPEDTTTTWSVRITDSLSPSVYAEITQASSSESWGGVTWYKAASPVLLSRGDHVIDCELAAFPGTLSLNALVGLVEV